MRTIHSKSAYSFTYAIYVFLVVGPTDFIASWQNFEKITIANELFLWLELLGCGGCIKQNRTPRGGSNGITQILKSLCTTCAVHNIRR